MQFNVVEAKRELIWAKLALMAPSGGGKTYGALRLATGMLQKLRELGLEQNGKILMGNTEGSRGKYYANEFKYDIVNLGAPHHPEMYVDFIEYSVEQKYPIVLLDSTSHEWEGKGGCLELHQQAGGRYQDWDKITPRHRKFIETIADSQIHLIATMRGKDQYSMSGGGDSGEKLTVKKLGVGAKQREGFEYEFTTTFLIDQATSMSTPQKDNTHLFEDEGAVLLTEKHGYRIIEWANSGDGYTPPVRDAVDPLEIAKDEVVQLIKQKKVKFADKVVEILGENYKTPKQIKEINEAEVVQDLKTKLSALK